MIFYFSGTGNTRWVAQQLSQATGERLVDIAQALRQNALHYTLEHDERLGFCFPTHGWQPPHIMRNFIERVTITCSPNTYTYAVTTCGDDTGETITIFNNDLRKKGFHASTLFSVIMPETYVCLPFMLTDTPAREHQKIAEARTVVERIAETVKRCETGVVELERGAAPRLYSYVIGAFFNRWMITDRKFTVDSQFCIQCGLCAKVCPVGDIAGAPPVWLHNGQCTCCLSCYHHCPTHAINYGSITRKRGQYYFKSDQ